MSKTRNSRLWRLIAVSLVVLVSPVAVSGKVIYVDDSAPVAGNGTTWENAYNYLQDAMVDADSAVKPVEIRVAQGIYRPDQGGGQTPGNYNATFQLISGVTLKGGYAGYSHPEPNKRDPNQYKSILSGDLAGNDTIVNSPGSLVADPFRAENCIHVVTGSGTDASTVLDGFVITAGNANVDISSTRNSGGGMYNDSGSPTVFNCTFTQNMAFRGAGAYCAESNSVFENCTFSTNGTPDGLSCPWGGGIYAYSSNIRVIKCSFRNNYTNNGGDGAGMCNWKSSAILSECAFIGNSSTGEGGGVQNERRSSVQLRDCSFIGNYAQQNGGGIANHNSCDVTLINCTFSVNSARFGGGVSNVSDCDVTLSDCIFMDNSAEYGGGLYNTYSSGRMLTNCIFSVNWAEFEGGAMYNRDNSNPDVINCTFRSNSARTIGGAIYNGYGSSPTLTNCRISSNLAEEKGGAIYNYKECMPIVTNCTFAANVAPEGKCIACDSSLQRYPNNLQINNCIIWDGDSEIWNNDDSIISITYSDIQGGWPGTGSNNINADPLFADPNGLDGVAGTEDDDFRLLSASPCIDAGDNNKVPINIFTDLDNRLRFVDDLLTTDTGNGGPPTVDMGAYEFACTGNLDDIADVALPDFALLAEDWLCASDCSGDIDGDGDTDFDDLLIQTANWLCGAE